MSISIMELCILGKNGYKKFEELKKLFAEDIMVNVLKEIGKTEYKAAIEALQSAKNSLKPEREIAEAVTHIRSSILLFEESASQKRLYGLLEAKSKTRIEGFGSAISGLLIMAICYKYLGENANAREVLSKALSMLPFYEKALIDSCQDDANYRAAGIGMGAAISDGLMLSEINDVFDETENEKKHFKNLVSEIEKEISEMMCTVIENA
jgi:tetratricopeptide (TPR) repeat protein